MDFRKLLSRMNKDLDTIQIKQCADNWSQINHSKTTSITGMKQRKALLNVTKNGEIRSYENDRIECAINYKKYFEELKVSAVRTFVFLPFHTATSSSIFFSCLK